MQLGREIEGAAAAASSATCGRVFLARVNHLFSIIAENRRLASRPREMRGYKSLFRHIGGSQGAFPASGDRRNRSGTPGEADRGAASVTSCRMQHRDWTQHRDMSIPLWIRSAKPRSATHGGAGGGPDSMASSFSVLQRHWPTSDLSGGFDLGQRASSRGGVRLATDVPANRMQQIGPVTEAHPLSTSAGRRIAMTLQLGIGCHAHSRDFRHIVASGRLPATIMSNAGDAEERSGASRPLDRIGLRRNPRPMVAAVAGKKRRGVSWLCAVR